MKPHTTRQRRTAMNTSRNAHKLGWPSPLDLDEDGYLENELEPMAPIRGRPGVDLDEWLHLVYGGVSPELAASRLGAGLSTVERAARRGAREDVLAALRRAA